ncbi:uncharacterized protein LOC111263143 isoform X2 [Varroa jacobsoni]|nr:uncharacterized protein LOC111252682 isoform X2 [Varroa destructor]XP_022666701.1 uncharacterized protein LOC111252682 isoform X2 [Varroa destructor]XP_022666702.1 uncharacterized protein LOC111252682 isoform X2 [Varroa destructor]XP_022666703.1 uncharacterized protein LOC111252682 isoform X2 [Varroa destructor]XP_022666704.1 uncharacterized protein LOC111252682 isoform X2 [Varroa destructor]XP_022693730.1 uncharacterized protein LOC111263143 isoform X2 [Varroa jacobsoni]XP_022693731.1 unc
MDEIEGTRTSVAIVTNSPPDEIPPTGSTRKAFVTCDGRASFDSSVVLSTVASFLREKVFPIIGDHCLINLHWNGTDLSTLHVRSVVPDSHVLLPRTAAPPLSDPEQVASSLSLARDQDDAAFTSPPANITIKEEPIDVTDELIIAEHEIKQELNVDQDDSSSDEGKFDTEDQMIDTEDEILNGSGTSLVNDKQYDDFRPKPPVPALPPAMDHAAFPMYLPQSSMIPMIPVVAFSQSQLPCHQMTPMLLSPMQTMSQLPIQGLPLVSGYNHCLQSPFGIQPVTLPLSQQHQAAAEPNVILQRNTRYV